MNRVNALIIKIVMAVYLLFTIATAKAVSTPPITFSDIFRDADVIAIVRLTKAKPVVFEHDSQNFTCGTVYSANTLKNYKGHEKTFKFFAANELEFLGKKRDFFTGFNSNYFIVASGPKNNKKDALLLDHRNRNQLTAFERAYDECLQRQLRKNVISPRTTTNRFFLF